MTHVVISIGAIGAFWLKRMLFRPLSDRRDDAIGQRRYAELAAPA